MIGAFWWCLSTALFAVTLACGLMQPVLQRRRATRADLPPVSALVPIKHLDPGFERAQASIFIQDYPAYEVLISAVEEDSPALDAARRVAGAHPERPCRILRSAAQIAVSPKLNNLAAPFGEARNDFVFTKDSNMTLAPDVMAAFMRSFSKGVGLVVAVPVAVRPQSFAGRIEAILLNGHARLLLAASVLGLGYGVGKVMLFRRSDLAKAGGLEAVGHMLAEDTAISMALARQGLRTVFSHRTVAQEIGARSLREVYERQARWSVIRRANEKISFPLEPLASPLPAALAGALAGPLIGLPASLCFGASLAGWFCAEILFTALKGWEISAWAPLAFLGREILALAAWLRAWTTHDVVWGEGRFDARRGARDV